MDRVEWMENTVEEVEWMEPVKNGNGNCNSREICHNLEAILT